jgi:serine/threonine-protein kinase PRP4
MLTFKLSALGLPYDTAVDVWSLGCVLFELYTGDILFKGTDNNDMIRLIQETKGKFPARMLRKAAFASQHFSDDLAFEYRKIDKITGKVSSSLCHAPAIA